MRFTHISSYLDPNYGVLLYGGFKVNYERINGGFVTPLWGNNYRSGVSE
jgi:hypothetical protein